jgi:hypothetical protein
VEPEPVVQPEPAVEPEPVVAPEPVVEPEPVEPPVERVAASATERPTRYTSPPPLPGPPRRRRGSLVAGLALLVLVVAAVVAALQLRPDDTDSPGTASPAPRTTTTADASPTGTSPPTSGASSTPATTAPAGPSASSPASSPASSTAGAGQVVPAGFEAYTDPTGFSIAVPDGWQRSKKGSRTYFREAGTGRFLQVDQTRDPKPDALADWKNQEGAVRQRLDGYQRIRIEPVAYNGWDAADWEYTWRDGAGLRHVLSRNIRVSDDRAYALYFSVPQTRWEESRPLFDTFAATFRPAS